MIIASVSDGLVRPAAHKSVLYLTLDAGRAALRRSANLIERRHRRVARECGEQALRAPSPA